MSQRLFFFVLLAAQLLWAQPQEYFWPTEASDFMTSSFCEFRPRHYHAAIDIKTWNRSGYKIFAVDDGYIYRIRVAATGYGRALYVKLKDGNFAVYGHLQAFSPELEAYSDQQRLATRSIILDDYPAAEKFPVKRGQFIGYTGETGIGVPHLHFEMRNKHQHPINPMPFFKSVIKDNIAPLSRYLAIIPQSTGTYINFEPDTLIRGLPLTREVALQNPVYLTGPAFVAIRSFDMAQGVNNQFDLYRAEMFINDSLVYQVQYDRFSYSETRLIELDKNFSLWRKGMRIYHNFYRHPANSLPFYHDTRKGAGLLSAQSLREGNNRLRFDIYDYYNNKHTISLEVVYHRDLPVSLSGIERNGRELTATIKSPEALTGLKVARVSGKRYQEADLSGIELAPGEAELSSYKYYRITIPVRAGDLAYRIATTYGPENLPVLPFYIPAGEATSQPWQPAVVHYPDGALLKNDGFMNPGLYRGWPQSTPHQYAPDRFAIALPAEARLTAGFENTPAQLLAKTLSPYSRVEPGREKTVVSDDGLVSLYFPSNATYDPITVAIDTLAPHDVLPEPYRFKSRVYKTTPEDVPFNYGAWLRMTLPDSLKQQKGMGIYYFTKGKWAYLPTRHDPRGFETARITSLEQFVVIQDSVPPLLVPLNLDRFNRRTENHRPLRFSARDEMSGMYNEGQISVKINGEWGLFEFDPEEDWIIIQPRYFRKGENSLEITVTDNAGNTTRKTFDVTY
ncbi:MAG: M23 family metallopeptidase [Calditrichaeota bacterium]|nr:M23 family metallopeptidase [Calditrichota bacterium]HQU71216.1 M23 family metallopeptidase [Calditrichia bacterium]